MSFVRQTLKHFSFICIPHRDTGSLSKNTIFYMYRYLLMLTWNNCQILLQPFFPVNFLRNVALEHAKTKHIFLNDVDFEPMPQLEGHLKRYIAEGYLQGKTVGS